MYPLYIQKVKKVGTENTTWDDIKKFDARIDKGSTLTGKQRPEDTASSLESEHETKEERAAKRSARTHIIKSTNDFLRKIRLQVILSNRIYNPSRQNMI